MAFTNYPQGFAAGLSVRGMPLTQMQPGQVFFVGNGNMLNPQQRGTSDSNRGTFLDPFNTLQFCIDNCCLPMRGDIIFILPGHMETIADAATLLLGGCITAIIGLGSGTMRPTFTLTATAANVPVGATNMTTQNCLFVGNFLSITSAF